MYVLIDRKNRRKGETQRPNSIANETYTPGGFQQLRENDDEEYALITETDCDCITMSSYRPPVPERGTIAPLHGLTHGRKYGDDVDILTLDEYSKPSDSIPDTYMSSLTAEYTTTYDDPIRHTVNNVIGDNRRNDSEGTIMCETCVPQANNRDSKTKSKVLERNSRNSQNSALCRHSSVSDTKTDIIINDNISDKHKTDDDKAVDLELDEEVLEQKDYKQTDSNFVSFKPSDSNISKEALDDSDYEDTDITDGSYPTKCTSKRIFEEHVCLDCLKPEHLTKLGIKIIEDDNVYETHTPLQQRLSEPVAHAYDIDNIRFHPRQANTDVSFDDTQCAGTSARTNSDATSDAEDAEDAEETMTREMLNDKCVRRCSICNTVYDRLGNVQPNIWQKCTDNVYDQFGNFEQFKKRRVLARKRKNSF